MQRIHRYLGVAVAGTAALASVPLLGTGGAEAARFTGGNLVVYRVGNGTSALSNAAAPVFVDEYSPGGAKIQSIALPTATANGNYALTASGLSRSEGQLARSADGRFVTLTGYGARPGTAGPAGASLTASSPTSVARVIGIIDANGTVDTSTVLKSSSSPKIIRSAVSSNGDRIWAAGGNGGVLATSLGATAATRVGGSAASNLNSLTLQGRQLFTSGILADRLSKVGAGAPTKSTTLTALTGLPANLLTNGYAFLDLTAQNFAGTGLDTLYLANASERAGTVDKYTFDGATWRAAGYVDVEGASGLVANNQGGTVSLAVTTPTQLLAITDASGGASSFTPAAPSVLATAGANQEFRGVALAPVASAAPSLFVRRPSTTQGISQGSAGISVTALAASPSGISSVKAKLGKGKYKSLKKGAGNVWTSPIFKRVNKLKVGTAEKITVVATDKSGKTTTVVKNFKITAIVAPSGQAGPKKWSFTSTLVKQHGKWSTFTYKKAPGHKGLSAKGKKNNVTFTVYGRSLVLTFQTGPSEGKVKVKVGKKTKAIDLHASKKGKLTKKYVFATTGAASSHKVQISPASGKAVFLALFQVKS